MAQGYHPLWWGSHSMGSRAAGHIAAVAGKQRAMKTCAQLTSPFPKGKDPSLGDDATPQWHHLN